MPTSSTASSTWKLATGGSSITDGSIFHSVNCSPRFYSINIFLCNLQICEDSQILSVIFSLHVAAALEQIAEICVQQTFVSDLLLCGSNMQGNIYAQNLCVITKP